MWRDEDALRRAREGIFADEKTRINFADLEELSATWPLAKEVFEKILARAEAIRNPYIQLEAGKILLDRHHPEGPRVLNRIMAGGGDAFVRLDAAKLLARDRGTAQTALQTMVEVLRSLPLPPFPFYELTELIKDVPDARIALEQLSEDPREAFRLELALDVADGAPDLRSLWERLLIQLATSATDQSIRIRAAGKLKEKDASPPIWRDTLNHLSRHAKTGRLRLEASKILEDEARLKSLSLKAKKADVRADAERILEALQIHRELLALGKKRRGRVLLDGTFTGHIEETDTGSRFTYDPAYLQRPGAIAISPTLPLRAEPHESSGLHPFFENLLPEGWLLDLTCRKLGIDRGDAFGLLLATCADCAGAVEILPERDRKAA